MKSRARRCDVSRYDRDGGWCRRTSTLEVLMNIKRTAVVLMIGAAALCAGTVAEAAAPPAHHTTTHTKKHKKKHHKKAAQPDHASAPAAAH
jgi:hypothetical protein